MNYFKSMIAMLVVLLLTACGNPAEADYETVLFDTDRVHTIDVSMAESDWQDLLTVPEEKTNKKTLTGKLFQQPCEILPSVPALFSRLYKLESKNRRS